MRVVRRTMIVKEGLNFQSAEHFKNMKPAVNERCVLRNLLAYAAELRGRIGALYDLGSLNPFISYCTNAEYEKEKLKIPILVSNGEE